MSKSRYQAVSDDMKLRIDATILSYFQNNDRTPNGTFLDGFRNSVLEASKFYNETPRAAYNRMITELREAFAVSPEKLPALKSIAVQSDLHSLKFVINNTIADIVVGEVTSLNYKDPSLYRTVVTNELRSAEQQYGSKLTVTGPKPQTVVNYFNAYSKEKHQQNLDNLYSPEVVQAVKALRTGLNDYREAELITDAVAAVNNMSGFQYHMSSDAVKEAAREAIAADLKKYGIQSDEKIFSQVINAALPIAAHDGKGNDSWTR